MKEWEARARPDLKHQKMKFHPKVRVYSMGRKTTYLHAHVFNTSGGDHDLRTLGINENCDIWSYIYDLLWYFTMSFGSKGKVIWASDWHRF